MTAHVALLKSPAAKTRDQGFFDLRDWSRSAQHWKRHLHERIAKTAPSVRRAAPSVIHDAEMRWCTFQFQVSNRKITNGMILGQFPSQGGRVCGNFFNVMGPDGDGIAHGDN